MEQARQLKSLWIRAGGLRMHARVALLPPPAAKIVFVHGLGLSSRYMVPTASRLSNEFSVAAPDLPGFGRSQKPSHVQSIPEMADALADWMRATGSHPAALVGNSVGCQVAVDLAVRHPQLVSAMILSAPTVDPSARTAAQQVWRLALDGPREPFSLLLLALGDYIEAGLVRVVGTLRQMLKDRIEDKLPRVTVPTLIVCGERDPIVPILWATQAANLLPKGNLVVLPGCPHGANYSCPDALAAVIREFLHDRISAL
jgi:2-hydroxy-6-oxonona-2,4-dienedioate hydrolase